MRSIFVYFYIRQFTIPLNQGVEKCGTSIISIRSVKWYIVTSKRGSSVSYKRTGNRNLNRHTERYRTPYKRSYYTRLRTLHEHPKPDEKMKTFMYNGTLVRDPPETRVLLLYEYLGWTWVVRRTSVRVVWTSSSFLVSRLGSDLVG